MEIEKLNTKYLSPLGNASLNSSLHSYDLPILIKSMKQSSSWANGELNAMVLLKSSEKQIVLTALPEGTEIDSFQLNDSVTFQIIEGKLRFHSRGESIVISKDQLLTLHENIKYSLFSMEETVFLLIIAGGIFRSGIK